MMNDFADRLDRLNELFPELATPVSRAGVQSWQRTKTQVESQEDNAERSESTDLVTPGEALEEQVDIKSLCLELLRDNQIEDVLDLVLQKQGVDLSMLDLVELIGKEAYILILKRDVLQLSKNSISYEQIASLWNELGRPALAGPTWNGRSVSVLDR